MDIFSLGIVSFFRKNISDGNVVLMDARPTRKHAIEINDQKSNIYFS